MRSHQRSEPLSRSRIDRPLSLVRALLRGCGLAGSGSRALLRRRSTGSYAVALGPPFGQQRCRRMVSSCLRAARRAPSTLTKSSCGSPDRRGPSSLQSGLWRSTCKASRGWTCRQWAELRRPCGCTLASACHGATASMACPAVGGFTSSRSSRMATIPARKLDGHRRPALGWSWLDQRKDRPNGCAAGAVGR